MDTLEWKEMDLQALLTKLILFAGATGKSKEVTEIRQEIMSRFERLTHQN